MFHVNVITRIIVSLFVLIIRRQKDAVVAFTCYRSKYVAAATTKKSSFNRRPNTVISEYLNLNMFMSPPPPPREQQKQLQWSAKIDDNDFFDDEQGGDDDEGIRGANNIELLSLNDSEGLSDGMLSQLQEGQPSEFAIMKELLGINIFTYILAGLITIFLSLNFLLGPGWLGQLIGLEGTGTFTQMSDSLPDTIDLSSSENLL
mmetsp:Transcript_15019/g.19025  ORF Transcript_15019/g.19025 Transcript_15019/m.19025 type:complete len:203 (-) Transcript_15019:106-714(-)